jgi:hypothetical protein
VFSRANFSVPSKKGWLGWKEVRVPNNSFLFSPSVFWSFPFDPYHPLHPFPLLFRSPDPLPTLFHPSPAFFSFFCPKKKKKEEEYIIKLKKGIQLKLLKEEHD